VNNYNNIWLSDLTYTQQSIASDTVPSAIGMIAEYINSKLTYKLNIKIFKFPEDVIRTLETEVPDIFACSNYVWNSSLSSLFCRRLKEVYPDVVTVMGGPNFPSSNAEMDEFVRNHPWVDFFIIKEGEEPFLRLIKYLNGESNDTSNIIFLDRQENKVIFPENIDRVLNLEDIPSPYLSGRLDEFLDGRLTPVIQTNRGCPFSCTFCTEGQNFWNKVKRKDSKLVAKEVRYIAQSMVNISKDRRRSDLLIADSNFGMFKDDIEVCKVIADVQQALGYPTFINVSTGKNRKERVLEAASIVNGAMKLAGSVQSLDKNVLENIKRNNISGEQIVDLALDASRIGANTYSEVILALPGDSLKAHFNSLKTLVNAFFSSVVTYQLMILPGTELGLKSTKDKYKMVCKYRVQPRCFGVYKILGQTTAIAEIEEICIENETLPYKDYLNCRKMHFIINLFYNEGVFSELRKLLIILGIPCWDWLYDIYSNHYSKDFDKLIDNFILDTENELWSNKGDLEKYTSKEKNIKNFVSGEEGNNLLYRFKAISMTNMFSVLCTVAQKSINNIIHKNKITDSKEISGLVGDLILYKKGQIQEIFSNKLSIKCKFTWNVFLFSNLPGKKSVLELKSLKYEKPIVVKFSHSDKQLETINSYTRLFGSDVKGITRILARVFLKQLFRSPIGGSVIPPKINTQ
jgi:radical SAM superfamily enzyme YgiQ (UPF0313 family)